MSKDHFLDHPTVDKVMKVVLALARETYVLRDRLALIESVMDEKGVVTRADLDAHKPQDAEREQMNQAAHEFIASILGPIVRDQVDTGPDDETTA